MRNEQCNIPWQAKICPTGNSICIVGADGTIIVEIPRFVKDGFHMQSSAQDRANVRFIVKACNAHEELYKLLEQAFDRFTDNDMMPPNYKLSIWLEKTKQVLAEAKEVEG